ncbi:MAG: hypothetical protein HZA25_02640 [Candidatus Niyogibacteria bacterium]|nr:hypothetical protein [Candidatus Niyogibacteria bacterium]
MIDEPNRDICRKILESNKALFQKVQGASHNHQAWPGGYWDHVQETMNLAVAFYDTLDALRPLPFTRSDALLVLFLHDIEKPWKYELLPDGTLAIIEELREKKAQHAFRAEKLKEYGIALTPEQFNGLEYVEGEFEDYSSKRRVSGPLAAFCGNCDRTSARLWHDHPAAENDPWSGAKRISG